MTTPAPPPGRKDNGLPSADWGALVDLDPRLSEALLSSLAQAGVAAYVEPAGGQHAITRASQLPARPMDRLWVDPVRADAARAVVGAEVRDLTTLLAEQEPGATAHGLVQPVPRSGTHRVLPPPELPGPPAVHAPPATDVAAAPEPAAAVDPDEAFRSIVAGFDTASDHPVPPWPVSEDVEDEGHYVPPPPPPVPRLAPSRLAAVGAMLGGLLLLIAPGVLDVFQLSRGGVSGFGVVLLLGGAASLVLQMRDAPPTDTGPDDGAVV